MIVTLYGLVAVSFMMAMYALEHVHRRFVLAFAVGCLLSSGYGFLSGAWPFGIVEAIWAVIAVRRFRAERKPTLADTEATSSEHSPDAALSDGASVTNHSHTGPRSDTDPEFSERGDRGHRGRRGAKGGVARRGLPVSRGKRLVLLSLFTFLVMIAVGSFMGHHHADPSGTGTGSVTDFLTANGADASVKDVPVSQVGVNQLANEAGHLRVSINFTWLLMTGYLVLFMQVGFAFLVTGLTRAKNAGHMMMMNVAAFAVAFVAYYACGFAFHFGGVAPVANLGGVARLDGIWPHGNAGLLGLRGFFLQSHGTYDVGVLALFLFQVVFMETAGYIIIGAIAERISFAGFLLAELAMGAVIYPVYGNWVWGGGFLAHLGSSMHWGHGSVDFAGSGVVHATGGWAALALAVILGPRIGKFNKDGTPNAFPGHNLGYVVVGTMILLFGWMGFNPGSTLGATDLRISVVAVNTLLSACFGFIVAMAYTNSAWGKPDISMACNGMLAGLVAITAPCAFVAPWAASVIGIVAGLLVCFGVWFFDHVAHVDDPCGAISVHGVNGAWGVLSVGLFADGTYGDKWNGVNGTVKGLFYGDAGQLLAQAAHVVLGFIWAFGITYLIFTIGKQFIRIRVSPQVELEGLDMAEFGAVCYPDFVLAQSAMNPGHAPASAWTDEPPSRTSAPPESVPAGDGSPGGGGV